MNSNRNTAIYTGLLYIFILIVGILSIVYVIEEPDYLTKVCEHKNQVLLGAFFQLLMAPAYIGIALLLYPILREYNEGLSIGFVGFRFIAGAFHIVSVISIPLFLVLSEEFVKAGTPDLSYFQTLGELLRTGRDLLNHVGMIISLSIGGLILYYILYQSKLIPRWLSVWGLFGTTLTILASLLLMFQFIEVVTSFYIVLNIPMVLQEFVFALWLIIKGFNPLIVNSNIK